MGNTLNSHELQNHPKSVDFLDHMAILSKNFSPCQLIQLGQLEDVLEAAEANVFISFRYVFIPSAGHDCIGQDHSAKRADEGRRRIRDVKRRNVFFIIACLISFYRRFLRYQLYFI